jgi:hypothetical protein
MDKETLHKVENFIRLQQTHLQLTPPDIHCTNPAKHAIRTWKNHFLAGIAGLPKSFPIANWCRLTTQCDATLNMLCPCCQKSPPIGPPGAQRLLLFQRYPYGPTRHGSPCSHETQPTQHMGIPRIKSKEITPLRYYGLRVYQDANGRGWHGHSWSPCLFEVLV